MTNSHNLDIVRYMQILISLALTTLAVTVAAYITPGAEVDSLLTALIVAVVLGFMNAVVKPILLLLTLPINILTLGLFTIVINLLLLVGAEMLVPGFALGGFLSVIIFAVVLSLLNTFLGNMTDSK